MIKYRMLATENTNGSITFGVHELNYSEEGTILYVSESPIKLTCINYISSLSSKIPEISKLIERVQNGKEFIYWGGRRFPEIYQNIDGSNIFISKYQKKLLLTSSKSISKRRDNILKYLKALKETFNYPFSSPVKINNEILRMEKLIQKLEKNILIEFITYTEIENE